MSFLVQKQKEDLVGYSEWYPAWQSSAKADEIMRWAVEARNRVVKQADLDIHSRAIVRLSRDWLDSMEDDLDLPPHLNTHQIVSALLSTAPEGVQRGVMTIERRWVDLELPRWELLDATAHAYSGLVDLIEAAHRAADVQGCNVPDRNPPCVTSSFRRMPPCMIQVNDNRRLHVNLAEMTQMREKLHVVQRGDVPFEVVEKRYGDFTISGDAIKRVPQAVAMAKRILSVDKELLTSAWLLRGEQVIDGLSMVFSDQDSKLVQMHQLADRVDRARADGLVFLTETWLGAPLEGDASAGSNAVPPSKQPNRREALWVTGATQDGRLRESLTVFFRGIDGRIFFGPTQYLRGGSVNALRPVFERWRRMTEQAN
ncbi:hypothetical protein [Micromonospora tulbaghiae]|uniref:hypothetical protein n=1 Tax=Micromonospora tulbaghiae TaxID=479978 RepID=UPI0013C4D368|nr:hypothetical protein [Micromonospora tulbaghiae]